MPAKQKKPARRKGKTAPAERTEQNEPTASAVVVLKRRLGAKPATDTHSMAKEVLNRVAAKVGEKTDSVTVFKNISALSVQASRKFLEALAKDPAVASCRPNIEKQDLLIRPVSKKSVKIENYRD